MINGTRIRKENEEKKKEKLFQPFVIKWKMEKN